MSSQIQDSKLDTITRLLRDRFGRPETVLVAGCGDGREAAVLAKQLATTVIGIDINDAFDPDAADRVDLRVADATKLPFEDGSFELVFSFHMLEHVTSPHLALTEMRRVLRPGGGFWIGTPNRSRLVGYVVTSASLQEKLVWNIADWRARMNGRFRNELGAHAGFTRHELRALLSHVFNSVEDETRAYYASLYPRHTRLLALVERTRLAKLMYPSVYFAGRR